ncbi:MAG: DNA polymerase III subunit alpha [Caldilineales bacterium]|nr:DNA polymerase III subunit alpha [Caldilineales bacterium]
MSSDDRPINRAPGFVHLHVHSHFTLLGGTAAVEALAARAAAEGMSHLALTDTHALYGAVAFARACRQLGVQPIIGMEALVATGTDPAAIGPERLVLLATGPEGYRSLCRLSTTLQARPDRVRALAHGLDEETLLAERQGLIALVGGRRSRLEQLVRRGQTTAAARALARLAGAFDDHLYLALEIHRPADVTVGREMVALAGRFGVPVAAVQPVYCLHPQEQPRLRLLAAIAHNCRMDAVPVAALPDGGDPAIGLYWHDAEAMAVRFAAFPEALAATLTIADRCRPALPDGRPLWPVPKLPPERTADEALAALARAGLRERYGPQPDPAIGRRLEAELDAVARHGYAPLFLVVADIVRFARDHDIPVSTRGSVANALVAYCLGITTVDPIRHDLLFERFLNPARRDPPDIDLDFCSRRRDEVLGYVTETYGEERVALVATISTLKPRSALRSVTKALGLGEDALARLLPLLPAGWHPDPRRRHTTDLETALTQVTEPVLRRALELAWPLIGLPHHLGVHPGGVVIAPGPLTNWVPLQWSPKGFRITQFDHTDVEAIGLPKMDLLGIRALTVLADAAALVRRRHDPAFRLEAIPTDDAATAALLARGETIGVFQCESWGARRTLRQLRARTVEDLAVANAFFKPGPATGGMARAFIRRYRGEEPVTFLHPALAPILARTRGVLLFQEQILRVATEIAGLDWEQADHLRRGMSKFQPDEMAAMREAFIAGCCREGGPGLSRRQAETLWEQVIAFAGYGFNQGHATAYAEVSYRSAYLKAHYPAEFFCARLADWGGFHHPAVYAAEARRLGIPVHPPHVNHSGLRFTLSEDETGAVALWMGLGQVRGLRRRLIRALLAARREGAFTDLCDLWARVPLHPQELTHLIQCGALDGLGESRAALLAEVGRVPPAGQARQLAFDFGAEAVPAETATQRLTWERYILGWPVSVTPLDTVPVSDLATLADAQMQPGRWMPIAGYRLPGWTGGKGFFLSDGRTFALAVAPQTPPAWQPLRVHGRWLTDEWGMEWLEVDLVTGAYAGTLSEPEPSSSAA